MDKKVKEKKKKVENEIIFDPPIKPRYFPGEVRTINLLTSTCDSIMHYKYYLL